MIGAKRTIVIKEIATDKVVKSIDVTGKSDRTVERTIRGIEINLNHEEFFVEELLDKS